MASPGDTEARRQDAVKKRIVICADGTWDDPKDEHPTNVLRISRAIRPEADDGVQQVVFYDWGVGSYHARLRGGISGLGLMKNVQDGYRFIVHNHDRGDELFLFGFSRGAYTVRALAGFLNKCGILGRDRAHQIPEAFDYYKKREDKPRCKSAGQWREDHCIKNRGAVRFLGVWDTVGAFGIPTRALASVEEQDLFYDQEVGSRVEVARHAVALDEKRFDFSPTLWKPKEDPEKAEDVERVSLTRGAGPKKDAKKKVDVKQVWFAGSHGDVGGGGRPKNGRKLSDLALEWMAAEAAECGLALECHLHCDTRGFHSVPTRRPERSFWKALGTRTRDVPEEALVHESVKLRYEAFKDEEKERNRYDPKALKSWLEKNGGWDGANFVRSADWRAIRSEHGHAAPDSAP